MHVIDGFEEDAFLSASIVAAGYGELFGSGGGWVLDPKHTTILCSWGGDGGTVHRTCANGEAGVVGCTCPAYPGDSSAHFCTGGYYPFAPADLDKMLQGFSHGHGYNEVIVQAGAYRIEAAYGSAVGGARVQFDLRNRGAPFSCM